MLFDPMCSPGVAPKMTTSNTFSFSKQRIESLELPEPSERIVYHDTRERGLTIRVSSTGSKTFYLYRRTKGGGSPERINLGKFPQMSVEQARRKAAELNAEIEGGANPAEVKRLLKATPTLSQLFTEYGQRHGEAKASWKDDQQRFRDHIEPLIGKKKITQIVRSDLMLVLSAGFQKGLSTGTVRQLRALLSSLFKMSAEFGYIELSPATQLSVQGTPVQRDRFLQSKELPSFFSALEQDANTDITDLIKLALLTGARRGNISSMRWQDLDLDNAIWRISLTKNQTPHTIPLTSDAIAILKSRQATHQQRLKNNSYPNGKPFVFPGTGKLGHIRDPHKTLERIFDRAEIDSISKLIKEAGDRFEWPIPRQKPKGNRGPIMETLKEALQRSRAAALALGIDISNCRIENFTFHDLRRTLGSWQVMTGASLPVVGKSLNHKTPQATAIYARLQLDPVRESVGKATEKMLELGKAQRVKFSEATPTGK